MHLCKRCLTEKDSDGLLHQMFWPRQLPNFSAASTVLAWDELKSGKSLETLLKLLKKLQVSRKCSKSLMESILTPFCSFHKPICIFSNDLQCKMWWKPLKMSPNFWPLLYVYMLIMVKMCFCQKLSSLQVLVFLCLENKWALTSNSYWA